MDGDNEDMAQFYQDLYGVVNPYGGLPGSSIEENNTPISPYGKDETQYKNRKTSTGRKGTTMGNFLSSVLSALGGGGGGGGGSNTSSFMGTPPDGQGGAPYEDPDTAQAGLGLGDVISTIADVIKGKRDKKLINQTMQGAGRHATWLQEIAANPPHPGWVDIARNK